MQWHLPYYMHYCLFPDGDSLGKYQALISALYIEALIPQRVRGWRGSLVQRLAPTVLKGKQREYYNTGSDKPYLNLSMINCGAT